VQLLLFGHFGENFRRYRPVQNTSQRQSALDEGVGSDSKSYRRCGVGTGGCAGALTGLVAGLDGVGAGGAAAVTECTGFGLVRCGVDRSKAAAAVLVGVGRECGVAAVPKRKRGAAVVLVEVGLDWWAAAALAPICLVGRGVDRIAAALAA
jgi:hypothetical protein